jgi:hypothetical protein
VKNEFISVGHIKHRWGEAKIWYVCQGIQRQKGTWRSKWTNTIWNVSTNIQ